MFDPIEITDKIFISPEITDEDIPAIRDARFAAIVDLRAEDRDDEGLVRQAGMNYLHVDMIDHMNPTTGQVEQILDFVDPLLDSGRKILLHCKNGTGRAPLMAIAILAHRGMGLARAWSYVEDQVPNIGLTESQILFLNTDLAAFLGTS